MYSKVIWGERKVTKYRRTEKADCLWVVYEQGGKAGKGKKVQLFTVPLGFPRLVLFARFLPWLRHGFWSPVTELGFLTCYLRFGIRGDRCGETSALGSSPLHWILITTDDCCRRLLPFLRAPAGKPASWSHLCGTTCRQRACRDSLWKRAVVTSLVQA